MASADLAQFLDNIPFAGVCQVVLRVFLYFFSQIPNFPIKQTPLPPLSG
jgi:hypothetical protein